MLTIKLRGLKCRSPVCPIRRRSFLKVCLGWLILIVPCALSAKFVTQLRVVLPRQLTLVVESMKILNLLQVQSPHDKILHDVGRRTGWKALAPLKSHQMRMLPRVVVVQLYAQPNYG